ncbi:UxaA family hydrolase [Limosilactobacillus sp. STM2_1]|uniref:UxaA family hydrolase n=1 Tax=Limosilactobacillus rudii TaxID=2759755 RepID=A0A7W3UJJ1_9LACO|nr:UxaA family hydrolase [Limosilactobacillus rudii]MBB1078678.1 UxaA family hydrolase [Limosilactobacillus rudii]MBB1096754.1 UxaA family hydrolase [Limosilactobacillus rudii]MCD7135574.1 altronate dehydratase family protein [Limosilactobacillus rudii]
MKKLLILNSNDNVAIATTDISAQSTINIDNNKLVIHEDIPVGNKVLLTDAQEGTTIIKFGQPIGQLTTSLSAGSLVNKRNLTSDVSDTDAVSAESIELPNSNQKTFMGYRRKNGKVGIRNDLYIVPTVGCITPLMDVMVQQFKAKHPDNGSFDNIILLKHPYGCSQLGDDFEQTRHILCDAALHPNAGGVLVFGLGCENNQMDGMKAEIEQMEGIDNQRMKFLVAQEVKDEFANAQQMLEELNDAAANDHRVPVPLSELKVGLQSVRPDGLSTITADRLIAGVSSYITENGGTVTLTGIPALAGAKQEIINRTTNKQAATQVEKIFDNFKQYYAHFDTEMAKEPTDEEDKIGISTAKERALTILQLAGNGEVSTAVPYGQKLTQSGINLIESPNNDLIDSSAEASADCQMVIVSTGKGTPYSTYVPTIKVSSNTALAEKKQRWIDVDGETTTADQLLDYVLAVANGEKTSNEKTGLHGLAIFKIGVTE